MKALPQPESSNDCVVQPAGPEAGLPARAFQDVSDTYRLVRLPFV